MLPAPRRVDALLDPLRADAAATDREGDFPVRSVALLREAGLLAAPVPRDQGGESLAEPAQAAALLATLAAVGRANLVLGRLYEGHVNALQLVATFGTPAQRQRAAADAVAGRLFGVWNTEGREGVRLEAGPDGDGWRLAGRKTFASGLGHVDRAIVTAARDDAHGRGWQMLLVATDRQPPGQDRAFWKPLGMRASASFAADLSGLRVGADDLLGAPGDYYREPWFSAGAVRFAAVQQGGAEAVFDETRRFLRDLGRTGDPFQRSRIGEMAWRVESGRLWLDGAARHAAGAMGKVEAHGAGDRGARRGDDDRHLGSLGDGQGSGDSSRDNGDGDTGRDSARTVAYARLMRSAIDDVCTRVLELAVRSVGARGLLRPEPFERLHRDLTHYLRQPAPDAALADAGAHVLDDARHAAALWP